MNRNLSSKWTLPFKIFNFLLATIPIVWVVMIIFTTQLAQLTPLGGGVVFALFLMVICSALCFFWNSRLKFVSVDEHNLYVSRLWRETVIPLSEIKDVRLTKIGFYLDAC